MKYKSLADHSSRALLDRLMRVDLLLIDETDYLHLRPEQSTIFFKLMEDRYGKKATIITTNLEYEDWHGFLGQKKMVGALPDRLRHRCHTIRVEGKSLREPEARNRSTAQLPTPSRSGHDAVRGALVPSPSAATQPAGSRSRGGSVFESRAGSLLESAEAA